MLLIWINSINKDKESTQMVKLLYMIGESSLWQTRNQFNDLIY